MSDVRDIMYMTEYPPTKGRSILEGFVYKRLMTKNSRKEIKFLLEEMIIRSNWTPSQKM